MSHAYGSVNSDAEAWVYEFFYLDCHKDSKKCSFYAYFHPELIGLV
jgi:hypothetical protein